MFNYAILEIKKIKDLLLHFSVNKCFERKQM